MQGGGWVATHEDVTERRRAEDERNRNRELIARLAHYDSLTELCNRVLFYEQLDLALACQGERLAVLYIDLDQFKHINDTLGHSVGDALLKRVAARLRGSIRDIDVAGRLGGDEFAVIQRGIRGPQDTAALAQRIREAIGAPYELDGREIVTDASIGIAMAPDDSLERDQLLKNADLALYAAKAAGRATYRFYEPQMSARMKARQELEADLRTALSSHRFELHYQPILDLRTDRVTGCEALLRWHDTERGWVSPSELIPVAEQSGLIVRARRMGPAASLWGRRQMARRQESRRQCLGGATGRRKTRADGAQRARGIRACPRQARDRDH
jgi:diguanylate cyclase (GGDEF)-like protein